MEQTEHQQRLSSGQEAGSSMSQFLEDSGNCRRTTTRALSHLSGSLVSERRKLRHVLDWADRVLSGTSELHWEFFGADGLNPKQEQRSASPPPDNWAAGSREGLESRWIVEKDQQCEIPQYTKAERIHPLCGFPPPSCLPDFTSGGEGRPPPEYRGTIKDTELHNVTHKQTPNLESSHMRSSLHKDSQRQSANQTPTSSDGATIWVDKLSSPLSPDAGITGKDKKGHSEPEMSARMDTPINVTFSHQLKIPTNLSVYEQYQLCIEHLYGSSETQIATDGKTGENTAEMDKQPRKTAGKKSQLFVGENHIGTENTQNGEIKLLTEINQRIKGKTLGEFAGGPIHLKPDHINGCKEKLQIDAAIAEGNVPLNMNAGAKDVKGQKKRVAGHSVSSSSFANGGMFPRLRPTTIIKLAKKTSSHTCNKKHTPDHGYVIHQPTETAEHTYLATDCQFTPESVPLMGSCLYLPDELWLRILSLLPHADLSRAAQVCRRLHTLATDHTLWKEVRVRQRTLSARCLLSVGRRRPRSLHLHSCRAPFASTCGLGTFFSLCRSSLEELKVITCCGPGLHGDVILPLIGQLCDRVTHVDVSWSGATAVGVRALSGSCVPLKLKSVVLNGCQVTDEPLVRLVMKHKDSLQRLELFGCHFLTASCLQTIYEICPNLQHLNIGQVPKINAHNLTVLTSQLKCLISLNLSGLQAVTDGTVESLLQSCIHLQSLTLSSCPGVTDTTLHSIAKHAPNIQSLAVCGCKGVTDAGVHSLALACRGLEELDISSTDTGSKGVTWLAQYCGGHLRTVKISFCNVSAESILKLCRCCQRLKVLHVYGCHQVPAEDQIAALNAAVQVSR